MSRRHVAPASSRSLVCNCDGDWEHSFGVEIQTLDNPGWAVKVDLNETSLCGRAFEKIEIDRSNDDWLRCWVEGNAFKGRGGPRNLHEILEIFQRWAKAEPGSSPAPPRRVRAAQAQATGVPS